MSTTATSENIYDLLGPAHKDPAYRRRYMHAIPRATVVDRVGFILERCKDKIVLNLGCASHHDIHTSIKMLSKVAVGVDKVEPADIIIDFDRMYALEPFITPKPEIIICGELLEHLSNPGKFLDSLRPFSVPVIITVPNAFSNAATHWAVKNIENVNDDHIAWFSYRTMKTLVSRSGFEIKEFYWYGGKPVFAEGMIFVVQ